MRPNRFIALALACALPIVFLAATAPAAATPAASLLPRFEPDDKEKLARLAKELRKLKADLLKLHKIAEAAKKQGRVEVARGAARRMEAGKRKYAALERKARALKARLHRAHPARKAQPPNRVRRPIRTPAQRKIAVQHARRVAAAKPSSRSVRSYAARKSVATRRAVARARPVADRYARTEKAYRDRMHKLIREKAELEKRLKATHAGIAKLKKGYETMQRAKAARARAAARRSAYYGPTARGHGTPQAGLASHAVLNELRALRRDVHQLNQTMKAFLALARRTHGVDAKAHHKPKRKAEAKAKRPVRRASKAKKARKAGRKKVRRDVAYDDRFSL